MYSGPMVGYVLVMLVMLRANIQSASYPEHEDVWSCQTSTPWAPRPLLDEPFLVCGGKAAKQSKQLTPTATKSWVGRGVVCDEREVVIAIASQLPMSM